MEERVPPAGSTAAKDETLPTHFSPPPSDPSNLYVVQIQIPRDQVYRVPPPENAQFIANRTRNLPSNQPRASRRPICWALLALLLLCGLAAASILTVRSTLYKPKCPDFSVSAISTKNLDQIWHPTNKLTYPPEYDITIQSSNPNERLSVAYNGGGKASLMFKEQKIGNGAFPPTVKEAPHTPVDIPVVLNGKGVDLPSPIKKSLNDSSVEKAMQLRIEVPMEVSSWLRNEKMDLTVVCDFKVKDSLMKKPKISFEDCAANF